MLLYLWRPIKINCRLVLLSLSHLPSSIISDEHEDREEYSFWNNRRMSNGDCVLIFFFFTFTMFVIRIMIWQCGYFSYRCSCGDEVVQPFPPDDITSDTRWWRYASASNVILIINVCSANIGIFPFYSFATNYNAFKRVSFLFNYFLIFCVICVTITHILFSYTARRFFKWRLLLPMMYNYSY